MYFKVKRIIDFVLSLIFIVLFWWIYAIIAVIILIEDRGNVLFRQRRIGKDKSEFYILKFRTMKMNTPKDTPTHLLENPEQYITKVGKILRKTSLDELPQIFNILKGDMSIVGPRPALYNQYDLIEQRDKYGANAITPGLTGWAQINGRDELAIDVKARFDGEYVKKISFVFDVIILVKTVFSVFSASGIKEGTTEKKADYEDINNR